MLLVVVLQEKNAEVPPQLPQAAGVVNQTALTLAKIAKQLAEANYKVIITMQLKLCLRNKSAKQDLADRSFCDSNAKFCYAQEHPSIQNEIVDAASIVEKAVATLETAVTTLQTSPKRQVCTT